ncbi:hypothetical protein F2Q69_00052244 [Brassica cretica]|uniref:Uncharacterized protein n=1 Tax=Brassica cretica TaxID=69181 RepID=A0A8S9MWF8_BRACR|nr:hypothetical protein F2Q69_00052244 [Brassica cretica]
MSSSQNDKNSSDAEMAEASSQAPESTPSDNAPSCVAGFLSFRDKMAHRKAENALSCDAELPSSSVMVVAPTHEPEVQVPQDTGAQVEMDVPFVPDALAQPSGSSTTPILIESNEKATESMPPPSARKEIVLALRAPSATPFVSLIDGMIGECGFEVSRLARDLTEMQGKLFESEAMLNAIKDFHSAKVSKLEVQIGGLERNLGKTASSLLKEKKARKTKSSEVRRLQSRIKSGEGSTNRGVEEAKDALRVEFQTRLSKISSFLGSLECISSRDLALATVDGWMVVVQALQSACFLPTCSEDPEGQDPVVGENGGSAVPSLDEAMGEGQEEAYKLSYHVFLPSGMLYSWSVSRIFRKVLTSWDFRGRQDLGLLLALRGAMTSTYVSCYSFDLIPYRFKVRERFSAYMTCLVGIEHLSKDNF